jgi:acyl dehydratase
MRYFEDIAVGERFAIGRHTFRADEIKAFAGRFDPQPFHVDEEAARGSHFGALVASGWHTIMVWMRLSAEHRRALTDAMRRRGEPVANAGPGLGFRELKWLRPVFAGDTIDYVNEVIEARASESRPGQGLMTLRSSGVNQNGDVVVSFLSTSFVERRPQET